MTPYSENFPSEWYIPEFSVTRWEGKTSRWCVIIPVINEGERIASLLRKMQSNDIASQADIIIVDGGSTDGSLEPERLSSLEVRGVLVKNGPGKLSAQLLVAYAFMLQQGYDGAVTIDGNDKDDPAAISLFLKELAKGMDFIQASRFLPGGIAENTPKVRTLAIRLLHAPLLSVASGFSWTDTTQGFRGYSSKMLSNQKMSIFRRVFSEYELLAYLSYRAPRLGYACRELPTTRKYPQGEIPTKISGIRGNLRLLYQLCNVCMGRYNP